MRRCARAGVVGLLAALVTASVAPAAVAGKRRTEPLDWNERIRPFAEFVEEHRGLSFDHPVRVRFLSDRKLEKELRSEGGERSKDARELEEQLAGELLALGLVSEQIDLGQASQDLAADDVVGFYDPSTEELVVRDQGSGSIDAEVTIVHELTHALQDQHFDLDRLYRGVGSGSESLALDFLIEGDATVVENEYVESLSAREQDRYFGEVEDFSTEPLPEGVPYVLDILSAAPYYLGASYVYALDPDGGTGGRDAAFRHPPETEEVLLDPVALAQEQKAKRVPKPVLESGEQRVYPPEQFGVLTLYLMLATRLDARTALAAATGWGGDSYVGFSEAGRHCLRGNVTGDRNRDTDELEAALTRWADTMPTGAAEIERHGDVVTFTACAVEGVTEPTVERFDSVFYNVLGGRIYTVLDLASAGVRLEDARCAGDRVSTDPVVIAIYDATISEGRDLTDDEQARLDEAYLDGFAACGLPPPF